MNASKRHASFEALPVTRGAEVPIIVKYRTTEVAGKAIPRGVGVRRAFRLVPALAMSATEEAIEALEANPDVEVVWPDLEVHTMLDESVPIVHVPQVWAEGYTGAGVKIAIVDTGVDSTHPDLAGRVVAFKDFTGEGESDGNGHGTHVAGIAAGSGAASDGKYRGVAPEALILAARVLRSNGAGRMSDVMAGIEWAVEQGAQVINLSLGGPPIPCDGTDALSTVCDAAVEAGVVVCVAAGNSGPGERTVGAPGCARQVITVGATQSASPEWDTVTSFSSRGPTADGREKPDLCFPGANIIAPRATDTNMGTPINEYYTQASGTSMATPHATGVCALLLQADSSLTPAQIKERLLQGARSMGLSPNIQGHGRGDALAAIRNVPGEPLPSEPAPPDEGGEAGCLPSLVTALLGIFR